MNKRLTILAVMALVAGLMVPGSADALSCGDAITVDTTLTSSLGPCAGDGLIIMASAVTLDLNNKKIIGSGVGDGVSVTGVTDVTVKNGTIQNFNIGINVKPGSDGTSILSVASKNHKLSPIITGGSGFAVGDFASTRTIDVVIKDSKIEDVEGSGLDVVNTDNFTLENNEIKKAGTGRQIINDECGTGNGIFIFGSDGAQILNNEFKNISQSGILYWFSENGLIDNNEVTKTSFLPCGPGNGSTDFGAITIVAASSNTVVSNNEVTDNDDAAIGLRTNLMNIQINHNRLERNTKGIFFSRGATGTTIHNNCISKDDTGIGLQTDPGDSPTPVYVVNAENNFWGAKDGPSGDGPLGTVLSGSGEEINQKSTDAVDVEPFLSECRDENESE